MPELVMPRMFRASAGSRIHRARCGAVGRDGEDHAAREPRHGGRGALNDPAETVRVLETLRDEPSLGTWTAVLVLAPLQDEVRAQDALCRSF